MSGKGKGTNNSDNRVVYSTGYAQVTSVQDANNDNNNSSARQNASQPTIVTGWEYHNYARGSDRYVYIGKDDYGEPEFLDYGPKGGR
mmetsp:Transcript_19711/g.48439  ORF Transcript_19711/g.48439 Transcript_19711/m.48439 type:complete len:87 (+) Transcript_19711:135-395(+)